MPILIDGYNLLWSIQQTLEGPDSISDIQLCKMVGIYLQQRRESGEIIFDGTGPPEKTPFDNIRSLEVLFTGSVTDADTVIEDKIKASTSPRRLTIVSSDRRLRKAAQARKAMPVKSEVFWNNLQKQLSRKKTTTPEPPAKRFGLTESETKQWLKFFGLEQ